MRRRDLSRSSVAGRRCGRSGCGRSRRRCRRLGYLHSVSCDIRESGRRVPPGPERLGYVDGRTSTSKTAGPMINSTAAGAGGRISRRQVAVILCPWRAAVGPRLRRRPRRCQSCSRPRRPGQLRLVDSLSRPGGNVTGLSVFVGTASWEVVSERLRESGRADACWRLLGEIPPHPRERPHRMTSKTPRSEIGRYSGMCNASAEASSPAAFATPHSDNRQRGFSLGATRFPRVVAT